MISYIFKNKVKNVFVAVLAAVIVFIKLNMLQKTLALYSLDYAIQDFITLIPYLLIFLYIITLKREYKIKQWLFPIAFAILTLFAVFSMRNCVDEYTSTSINGLIIGLIEFSIRVPMLVGSAFCFVGTLSNFKRLIFLRIGILFCIVFQLIFGLSYEYLTMGNLFLSTIVYLSEIFRASIFLLFYISIFVLTFTKKSEYIDITLYVEARKIKKELKKAKILQKNIKEEFIPPVVPEGNWRCMGCGEILPDDKIECECGYKR